MAAFGTKVVALMMVLPSLLLLLQTSVEAVDILAYNDDGCSGNVGDGCYSLEAGVCCVMNSAAGVNVVNLLTGQSASVFTGGECSTQVGDVVGPNAGECFYEEAFSGAMWNYNA